MSELEPISIQVRQCSWKSTLLSFTSGFSVAMAACYLKPELPNKAKVVAKTTLDKTRSLISRTKSWLERKKEVNLKKEEK